MYSCLSITTIAMPLLAVRTNLELSLFNSLIACASALLRLDLMGVGAS